MQREINEKRQELLAKEESLRYVHVAITRQALCLHYRVTTATSKADWLPKGRSPSSPSELASS